MAGRIVGRVLGRLGSSLIPWVGWLIGAGLIAWDIWDGSKGALPQIEQSLQSEEVKAAIRAEISDSVSESLDAEMAAIADEVRQRGGVTIVDEIYLGLSFDDTFGHSALECGDDVISINSFSKYFSMTGWRLGWVVLPPALVPAVEKLAQNLYICPSTVAQRAALACFEPEAIAEYERRRDAFRARRDLVVPALDAMGLHVPVVPDGAFYAWADCSRFSASSWDFCTDLMQRAQVALTPGRDFGPAAAERYLRLSFASGLRARSSSSCGLMPRGWRLRRGFQTVGPAPGPTPHAARQQTNATPPPAVDRTPEMWHRRLQAVVHAI